MRFRTLMFMLAVMLPAAARAQEPPSLELRPATTTLEVGEAVDVQLVATNLDEPGEPVLPASEGVELRLINPIPSMSQMTSIIQGRMTKRVTYTWSLRLVALKEGEHTLGPVKVRAGGREYETAPTTFTVRRTEVATGAKGDRYIFVEMSVEPRSIYVTQSVTATLTIGIRKLTIDGRRYDLNLLRANVLDRNSEYSVFANSRATQSSTWLTDSTGRRHEYEVYRVVRELRGEQVGPMTIGPVFIRANYPTALRQSFFGGYEIVRARRESARADVVTVEVNRPPAAGQPSDFTGAIGQYAMRATVRPERVELGQPLTLTLVISGQPLEGIAGPDLSRQAELASRFDFALDEWIGDLEGGSKVFRRAIFPKSAGEQTIPPLTWSYFDPQGEQYVRLSTTPLPINVDVPTGGVPTRMLELGAAGRDASESGLTMIQGGIAPLYADPQRLLVSQSTALGAVTTALVFTGPPFLCLGCALMVRRRERMRADAGYARRIGAVRRARARLRQADGVSDPATRDEALAAALMSYLSDRFNLPPGKMTPREIAELITARGFANELADTIAAFLEQGQAARYAPGGGAATADGRSRREQIESWIRALEKPAS